MMTKQRISTIVYAVLWAVSLIISSNHNALDSGCLFFYLCSACAAFSLIKGKQHVACDREKTGYKIAEWIIAVYFAFALMGRSFFMQEARFDFSVSNIVDFIIVTIALSPLTPGLLSLFGSLSKKRQVGSKINVNRTESIKVGFLCGGVVFVIDFLLTLSYYPCTMTNDSFGHWQQATGTLALSDYSPIAFNLLLKGLFSITGFTTPFIYVIFQTIVLSVIVGDITAFLHRRGVEQKKLIIGSIIFAIVPSTYMFLLYLSKNPLTGILCLGMVLSLLQVIIEPDCYLAKPLWYIKTVFIISGVYLTRENNVVIIISLIGFAIWVLLTHKEIGKKILIVAGGVVFVILLMTQGIYRLIEYEHADKSHETVRPLLAPIGSALQQELSLPEDILETTEKALSTEEWVKRYDPYSSDPITWGDPRPQYKNVSIKEAFSAYLKMLRLYPDVVIKDRLDGMNLIWDMRADMWRCPLGLQGDTNFKDAKLPDGLIGETAAWIKSFATSMYEISAEEEILDIFIWKNGIYVYLLLVTALFLFQKKKVWLLWAILPSTFILLTYVLVIAWQMYFYVWFFPLSVVLLMIVTIVENTTHDSARSGSSADGS